MCSVFLYRLNNQSKTIHDQYAFLTYLTHWEIPVPLLDSGNNKVIDEVAARNPKSNKDFWIVLKFFDRRFELEYESRLNLLSQKVLWWLELVITVSI